MSLGLASRAGIKLAQQATGGGSVDPDLAAWLVRVASAGGTVSAGTQSAVGSFIASAKSAGIWSLFRRLNLCCGDFNASFVPVVNTSGGTTDTNVNLVSGDYSESLGWQTDGSTKYINTGYIPSEATGGISAYFRSAAVTGVKTLVGCRDAGAQVYRLLFEAPSVGSVQGNWGDGTVLNANFIPANYLGLSHISRTSGSLQTLYKNGVSGATSVSPAVPASSGVAMYVLCQNSNGTPAAFFAAGEYISAYAIDSGMDSTQAAAYYTAMQTFQTALGRQV